MSTGPARQGWIRVPLKSIFRIIKGSTPSTEEADYWNGGIPWITPDDLGRNSGKTIATSARTISERGYRNSGTTLAPAGSIVLSTRAPIGHMAITRMTACINQGCRMLVPRKYCQVGFFYYLFAWALVVRRRIRAVRWTVWAMTMIVKIVYDKTRRF